MQSNFKRVLGLVLVLLMALALVPMAAFAEESDPAAAYQAWNVSTGTQYTSVKTALAEALPGETVTLLCDTQISGIVTVLENTTLDLNGYTLQARYLSVYGDLIDGSPENTGLLQVDESRILMQAENAQLPVRTEDGFRFVEVVKFNTAVLNNGSQFVFQPVFEPAALALLKKGKESTDVRITVRVSWTTATGYRSQSFVYNDEQVNLYADNYNAATGKYGKMFTLHLRGAENFKQLRFQAVVLSGTGVEITSDLLGTPSSDVTADANNQLTEDVTVSNQQVSALVPTGTLLVEGATEVTLTVAELGSTGSDVQLGESQDMISMDVHIAGVSPDNTTPIIVTLGKLAPECLSQGNIALYHVENGQTVAMTRVYSMAELDAHNEYYYDIPTGTVTVALATFSEVAVVADASNPWNGAVDKTWYDEAKNEFTLYNADDLAGLSELVHEGKTFDDKTIKLGFDINLYGMDNTTGERRSFQPIGVGYDNNRVFMGTFDGAGHTIHNLYQNGWALTTDDISYSYSTSGGGLFAYAVDATFKDLTMKEAYIVMECVDMGTLVGYAYGNCSFTNIVVSDSTVQNYNRYTGGVVGEVGDIDGKHNFQFYNVDVDAGTTLSALWGTFDPAVGGIIGGKYGTADVYMEKCDVACKLDVYNDVTSAYRWYSYRRCGMLIGYTEESKNVNGRTEATASFLTTVDCTVQYGDWAKYHYCEFSNENYPFVRMEAGLSNAECSNPRYGHPKAADGTTKVTSKDHKFEDVHKDGESHNMLATFHQLYGGGQGCYGGNDHIGKGVTELSNKTPMTKFAPTEKYTITTGKVVTLGELFSLNENVYDLQVMDVHAYVSPTTADGEVRASFGYDNTDWTKSTLTFSGKGEATVTITDYYYCTPTVITVTVSEQHDIVKFQPKVADIAVTTGTTLKLGDLFRDLGDLEIKQNAIAVNFTSGTGTYTANATDWTQSTVTFNTTGDVTITITDNHYCLPSTLDVTVVADATTAGEHIYCLRGHKMKDGSHGSCDLHYLVWQNWNEADSLPAASGNYRLTQDITTSNQAESSSGQCINLDLCGFDVTTASRLFLVKNGGAAAVTDTSGNPGTVKTTLTEMNETTAGGGLFYVHRNSTLGIYGGLFDARALVGAPYIDEGPDPTDIASVIRYCGTVMHILDESVVTIEGGTMYGGTSWRGATIFNRGTLYIGGNAVINGGHTNNMGGTIFNTKTAHATVGGNAVINNGVSASSADGIVGGYITVTDNASLNSCAYQVGQIMPVNTDDTSTVDWSARRSVITLNILTQDLTISGNANINGQILIPSSANYYRSKITIAGTPKFNIPEASTMNHPALFFVGWGIASDNDPDKRSQEQIVDLQRHLLDTTELQEGTTGLTVRLPDLDRTGVFGVGVPGQEAYIKSNTNGYDVIVNGKGELEMVQLTCGLGHTVHDHYDTQVNGETVVAQHKDCRLREQPMLQWIPWYNETSLPTEPGNYRLMVDITTTKQVDYLSGTWNIDLNGHTVSAAKHRRIMLIGNGETTAQNPVVVNLYDSGDENGNLGLMEYTYETQYIDGNKSYFGSIAYIHQNSTLNAYNVHMDVSATTSGPNGGALCMGNTTSVVNLYDCEIQGTKTPNIGGNAICVGAGSLRLEDTAITTNVYISESHVAGTIVLAGNTQLNADTGVRPYGLRIEGVNTVIDCTNWTPSPMVIQGSGKLNFASVAAANAAKASITAAEYFALRVSNTQLIVYPWTCLTHGNDSNHIAGMNGGCTCTTADLAPWVDWTETTSLPTSGYWRLTENVTLNTQVAVSSGTLHLNLNSKTVTAGGTNAIRLMLIGNADVPAIVNLYNGTLKYVNAYPDNRGSIIYVHKNGTLNAYDVTMDASSLNNYHPTASGELTISALYMQEDATAMNLYGCVVTGAATNGRTLCRAGGKLHLEDTTVTGGVRFAGADTANLELVGNVQLLMGGYIYGLYPADGGSVDCSKLTAGSKLDVHQAGTFTFASADAASTAFSSNIIVPASTGYIAAVSGTNVVVSKTTTTS